MGWCIFHTPLLKTFHVHFTHIKLFFFCTLFNTVRILRVLFYEYGKCVKEKIHIHVFFLCMFFLNFLSCLAAARSGDAQYDFRFHGETVCLYFGVGVDVTISVASQWGSPDMAASDPLRDFTSQNMTAGEKKPKNRSLWSFIIFLLMWFHFFLSFKWLLHLKHGNLVPILQ